MAMKSVRKTINERRTGTVEELRDSFNQLLQKMCGHTLRIKKQFSFLKHLKEDAGEDTAIVIVDFSENCNAKYARDTQGPLRSFTTASHVAHRCCVYLQQTSFIHNNLSIVCTRTACNMAIHAAGIPVPQGAFPFN